MQSNFSEEFFGPWEIELTSWGQIRSLFYDLSIDNPERRGKQPIVWRGLKNISYPLHSTLHRKLINSQSPVTESKVCQAESHLLKMSEEVWELKASTLEIFAELQHHGGATRFLDVSFNPLVALWFAVESITTTESQSDDARLFAFIGTQNVTFKEPTGSKALHWETAFDFRSWHHGPPLLWNPSFYSPRISAQNAAFLLSGMPRVSKGQNYRYRKAPSHIVASKTWKISEVRNATSIPLALKKYGYRVSPGYGVYVFRIPANLKKEIEAQLARHDIHIGTLFPEREGFLQFSTTLLENQFLRIK